MRGAPFCETAGQGADLGGPSLAALRAGSARDQLRGTERNRIRGLAEKQAVLAERRRLQPVREAMARVRP